MVDNPAGPRRGPTLRVALCQVDTVVGDVEGNADRLVAALGRAEACGAHLLAAPELALTGYPPEDLLLKPGVVAANLAALERVAARTGPCAALVGFVDVVGASVSEAVASAAGVGRVAREAAVRGAPRHLRNALALCAEGRVVAVHHKRRLPNYGVFDEDRWFAPGTGPLLLTRVAGVLVGMSVCEDLWFADGPVPALGAGGAQLVVNVNASPFAIGRQAERLAVLRARAAVAGCPIAYVNQVGGQDELVFDGGSVVVGPSGAVVATACRFGEVLLVADVPVPERAEGPTLPVVADVGGWPSTGTATVEPVSAPRPPRPVEAVRLRGPAALPSARGEPRATPGTPPRAAEGGGGGPRRPGRGDRPSAEEGEDDEEEEEVEEGEGEEGEEGEVEEVEEEEEVYAALVLGTRDYVGKNGFSDVVIGLSGGIDSSLVAAVAVDALGPDRVHGVAMPSRYSSAGSVEDARALAGRLRIGLDVVAIEPAHVAFTEMLAGAGAAPAGLTDENLQSRIRGVVLMALSNAHGWLVLTTGNKSELATGYSTLYGDTAGGFAVIKDVPKTLVYRLCRYRNAVAGTDLVPESVLAKPPSAELRPGQRDDQSLPPYEVLDPVLAALVEDDRSLADVVAEGMDPAVVARVARLVDLAEYKRRQSPIGIRISTRAFGKDRRMPITHRYREEPAAEGVR